MNSLFSMVNKADDHDQDHSNKKDSSTKQHDGASNSELFSSAKLVADAAKSTFNNESDKVDKGKVAGAAADLLDGASRHAKLEESSYGKHVEKAENYLHDYHSKHATTTTTTSTTDTQGHEKTTVTHTETEVHSGDGGDQSGGGGYLKMAQGFMK